ncbi:MAG: hypothetical protein DI628_05935 [Blastochloris viridis]|uniref:DNA helicase Pif1-like DEAD-box helicase domain-containing protein n=1 Tax=Blastochloris viridis TaxID=1079 RepID=A0A6N4R884_BLAVI|nr:MAG: hypothetical protein DI628_05935 [Blastochloris viridis]
MSTLQPAETAPKPAPRRWTPDEEAALTTEFKSGLPIAQIASMHERTVGAITARLQLMDLISYGPYSVLINAPEDATDATALSQSGQPWTEPDTARLIVAHHTGGTAEAITALAEEMGRTPRSLALKIVNLGLVTPTLNPNPNPAPRPEPKPKATKAPVPVSKPTAGKSIKISVTPEFQTAWNTIQDDENLLILGSAGTGKSTFLKWLRKQLENPKSGKASYAVLAPTGMAALNVGGQTIHSFFGLKRETMQGGDPWHKPRNAKVFSSLKVLVIDEISMVRADIFDTIDRFLRKYGPSSKLPFGGVQMVLMGDLCQLPPVLRSDEAAYFSTFYQTPFFFSSHAWENGNFGIVQFTHIFRQTDLPFIDILNKVRYGQTNSQLLATLNERLTDSPPTGAVVLASRNRTVEEINAKNLESLKTPIHKYEADTLGDIDPNSFTTPQELILKVGARVMFTRNDPNQRWVNGSLGEVIHCGKSTVTVKMPDGETHIVEATKWEATKYRVDETTNTLTPTVAGTFTQIPLTLAWALTIHKAQGQTLPHCVIDLSDGGTFAEGQLYVALSRARSLESVHLTAPIQARHIKTNPAVLSFYQHLLA